MKFATLYSIMWRNWRRTKRNVERWSNISKLKFWDFRISLPTRWIICFRCKCGEMFNREVNYTIHMATHNLSDKELRCPLCQKVFRRAASFRCHLKLHAVDDVVSCLICHEEFANNVSGLFRIPFSFLVTSRFFISGRTSAPYASRTRYENGTACKYL